MVRIISINRWSVFVIFAVAYFLSTFFRSANAVIAPTLSSQFSLSAADLGLMTSLFFATFAITQLPLGIALDRWGPRWVIAVLMLIAVAGSFVFAFGTSFPALALGRILLGIGLAGNLMGGLQILSQWFPKERFASVTGLLTGIGALGGLVATTPMAWLNELFGWRAIFMGGALLVALTTLFIIAGTRNQPPDIATAARGSAQINLLAIFRNITFWRLAAPVGCLAGFGAAFRGLWAGPYLVDIYGLSEIETGNLLLLTGIAGMAGSFLVGWLSDQLGAARVTILCSLLLISSQGILATLPPTGIVAAVYVVIGVAGSFPIAVLAQARQIFPPHMTGQIFTMLNMIAFGATFLLQWWIGELLAFFPSPFVGHSLPQGYSIVLAITAVLSVLTLLCYMPLLRPRQNAVTTLAS